MITEDRAVELARDAGALMGISRDNDWQAGWTGDLGWSVVPGIRRSNLAFAVSRRGQVATFPMSAYSPEAAVQILATLPDVVVPPAPEEAEPGWHPLQIDEEIAAAMVRRYLAGDNPSGLPVGEEFTEWETTTFPDRGWLFEAGTARLIVTQNAVIQILHPGREPEESLGSAMVPYLPKIVQDVERAAEEKRDDALKADPDAH